MGQLRGDVTVRTGVESAEESLETYREGLWTPEKVEGDFGAFKAHVLAQKSVDEQVHLVSVATKINGLPGIACASGLGICASR